MISSRLCERAAKKKTRLFDTSELKKYKPFFVFIKFFFVGKIRERGNRLKNPSRIWMFSQLAWVHSNWHEIYHNFIIKNLEHLQSSEPCRKSCYTDCFEILYSVSTKFQLKLDETMHINWKKPNLNQQVNHVNLTLTL